MRWLDVDREEVEISFMRLEVVDRDNDGDEVKEEDGYNVLKKFKDCRSCVSWFFRVGIGKCIGVSCVSVCQPTPLTRELLTPQSRARGQAGHYIERHCVGWYMNRS